MERLTFIPNVFYDIIVFVTPCLVLATGVLIGIGDANREALTAGVELSIGDSLLVTLGVLFAGYEYGRIAEAWSSIIVQRPLVWLSKSRIPLFNNADFNRNVDGALASLREQVGHDTAHGSKWTLYFLALLVDPAIGSDLLKRYAWEKLARSSAFSVYILALVSIVIGVGHALGIWAAPIDAWQFGSIAFTATAVAFTGVLYIEYYRRNCWNNDLLDRVAPVLALAAERYKRR